MPFDISGTDGQERKVCLNKIHDLCRLFNIEIRMTAALYHVVVLYITQKNVFGDMSVCL